MTNLNRVTSLRCPICCCPADIIQISPVEHQMGPDEGTITTYMHYIECPDCADHIGSQVELPYAIDPNATEE